MGLRDIEAGAPVRPDTLFSICSVTKSFTATGLALLVDEGKFDWNTPVRETLPEFRLRDLVVRLRRQLKPEGKKVSAPGISAGSQTLVLWRNRQQAGLHRGYTGEVYADLQKLANTAGGFGPGPRLIGP